MRPVVSTAAMITGTTIGKKIRGNIISLARVLTAISENGVPTALNPSEANTITNQSSGKNSGRSYKIENMGNIMNSKIKRRMNPLSNFPK